MVWLGQKLCRIEEAVQCLFYFHHEAERELFSYAGEKQCNVYSTFIIKQNMNYFPMQVLYKVLLARHSSKPAGHRGFMQTTIDDVEIFAMAYAWLQKGMA